MPAEMGTASSPAVSAESCLGDKFLVEGMRQRSEIKLIPHPFYGGDAIQPQFLPDLADMDVDGAVADDDLVAPDLVEDLVAQKDPTRPRSQQVEQFEFFFGEGDVCSVDSDLEFGGVDRQVLYFQHFVVRLFVHTTEQGV